MGSEKSESRIQKKPGGYYVPNLDLAKMRRQRNRLTKYFDKHELSAMYAILISNSIEEKTRFEAMRYARRNCTKDEIASYLACMVEDCNKMIRHCLEAKKQETNN